MTDYDIDLFVLLATTSNSPGRGQWVIGYYDSVTTEIAVTLRIGQGQILGMVQRIMISLDKKALYQLSL